MFSFTNWNTSKSNPATDDPLCVAGHEDFLDVGRYAIWYLGVKGIYPFSEDNLSKVAVLGRELESITIGFMGMEVTNETKREVKVAIEKTIEHIFGV